MNILFTIILIFIGQAQNGHDVPLVCYWDNHKTVKRRMTFRVTFF